MTVRIRDLSRHYGHEAALSGVDLDIADGEFLALLGPSGAGKTTLLRLIAGLDRPDAGSVLIDQRDISTLPPRDRRIGFVFQNYALFRHMTVARNIAFGLSVRRRGDRPSRTHIAARVAELLALMQLSGLGERFPAQLSGGQRQRVALARALAIDPKVLLLDEPFGALDAKVRGELREWLHGLQRKLDLTTIFVTHDQHEAFQLADRVAILNGGRLEQVDSPAGIKKCPASPFVIDFVSAVRPAGGSAEPGTTLVCQCGGGSDAPSVGAPSVCAANDLDVGHGEEVTVPVLDPAPAEAATAFERPVWIPRIASIIPAPASLGVDLPAVAAGELWLLAVAASEATPFEVRVSMSANVIIYDRPLTDWVASLLPLGGYAEPATGDAVARCTQFVRDGWSVLRLIERSADADLMASHVSNFAKRLRLAGAPVALRVQHVVSDGNDKAVGEIIRLEDVGRPLKAISGPQASAVVFGAFGIAEAAGQAIMSNGLAG